MTLHTGLCYICWLLDRRWAACRPAREPVSCVEMSSEITKWLGSLPAEGSLSAGAHTEFADARCRDFGKIATQKAKCTHARVLAQWDDDPQCRNRSVSSAPRHRLAKMTWRLSAGKEYGCGRRDRSPKSGVETLGKIALPKAKSLMLGTYTVG